MERAGGRCPAGRWRPGTRAAVSDADGHQGDGGFSGEARVRYTGGFPVYSGVYVGTTCADDAGFGECVDSATLFDLTPGYRLPRATCTCGTGITATGPRAAT